MSLSLATSAEPGPSDSALLPRPSLHPASCASPSPEAAECLGETVPGKPGMGGCCLWESLLEQWCAAATLLTALIQEQACQEGAGDQSR